MLDRQMTEGIIKGLKSIENDRQVRLVAILSAAIAVSNADLTEKVIKTLKQLDVGDLVIYETVLQSYLFLGFPRMIEASLVYNKVYGDIENNEDIRKISEIEAENWYEDGIKLCRVVYGKNFEKLKKRFLSVSPELFQWLKIFRDYALTVADQKALEKEIDQLKTAIASRSLADVADEIRHANGIKVLIKKVDVDKPAALRDLADRFRDRIGSGIIVLGAVIENKVLLIVVVTKDLAGRYHAGKIIRQVAAVVGGGGGGRPDMAQAGGTKPENLDKAFDRAFEVVASVPDAV